MPRIPTLSALAALLSLCACANPHVPDFMVEGTLPRFGDAPAPPKAAAPPEPAAPQKAEKSKKEKSKKNKRDADTAVAVAPAPPPPPVSPVARPEPVAAPPAVLSARPEAAPKRPPEAAPQPPIVGGFHKAQDKRKVQSVATFAADAAPVGYLLKGIESARTQVVAGTNYELCLKVRRAFRETSGWRTRLAKAEVYEDLSGNLTLMTWEEVKTCP